MGAKIYWGVSETGTVDEDFAFMPYPHAAIALKDRLNSINPDGKAEAFELCCDVCVGDDGSVRYLPREETVRHISWYACLSLGTSNPCSISNGTYYRELALEFLHSDPQNRVIEYDDGGLVRKRLGELIG